MKKCFLMIVLCFAVFSFSFSFLINNKVYASSADLVVDLNQREGASGTGIHDVSSTLYGIFFEDINHGADGGMSAEMINNQSFEYKYINFAKNQLVDDNQKFWYIENPKYATKTLSISGGMSTNNPSYLKIETKTKGYKIYNVGFIGDDFDGNNNINDDDYAICIDAQREYEFYFYARQDANAYIGDIVVYVQTKDGEIITTLAKFSFNNSSSKQWTKYTARIKGLKSLAGALYVDFQGKGTINVDFFSLMPVNAYGMNDPRWTGGKIKQEIIDIFAQMKPKFLRFPGGCVAEGTVSWENVYNWKHTVGKLTDRIGTPNLWEYWQSYNIGFYEYFLLCEDLNMKAMPVVSAGLICQARMGETGALIYKYDDPEFKTEVVDQTLHLIYFAKGSVNSNDPAEKYWAQVRTDMGHPEPFELDYISLGNENWGSVYWDNFAAAKRELENYAYDYYKNNPTDMLKKWGITLVTTSGTDVWGSNYYNAWRIINGSSPQEVTEFGLYKDLIVDEHYYNSPSWYISNKNRYDTYSRDGAKVFVGEYSANSGGARVNTLEGALAEAAFMTGLEKNSDIVVMASYAPFFGKEGNYNWATNAIWLNNRNIVLTPNYFVQQMFSEYVGDKYIPAQLNLSNVAQSITQDTKNKQIIIKLVNYGNAEHTVNIDFSSVSDIRGYYFGKTMQNDDNKAVNKLADAYEGEAQYTVMPQSLDKTQFSNKKATISLKKYSVSVLVFPYGNEGTDSTLSSLKILGKSYDVSSGTDFTVNLKDGASIPRVFALPTDQRAKVEIDYADSVNDTTKITVTAEDGTTTVYTINYRLSGKSKNQNNLALVIGLSVGGGVLIAGGAIATLLVIKKKKKTI